MSSASHGAFKSQLCPRARGRYGLVKASRREQFSAVIPARGCPNRQLDGLFCIRFDSELNRYKSLSRAYEVDGRRMDERWLVRFHVLCISLQHVISSPFFFFFFCSPFFFFFFSFFAFGETLSSFPYSVFTDHSHCSRTNSSRKTACHQIVFIRARAWLREVTDSTCSRFQIHIDWPLGTRHRKEERGLNMD